MEILNVGTNDDGTPHLLYHAPGQHVVLTPNHINGTVTVDGQEIDVTQRIIVADSAEHAEAIAVAIDALATPTDNEEN